MIEPIIVSITNSTECNMKIISYKLSVLFYLKVHLVYIYHNLKMKRKHLYS